MKYLKKFEKFDLAKENQPLEIKADMTKFNTDESNKKKFDKFKNQLKTIYMNYIDDQTPSKDGIATDLYNKLLSARFIKKGTPKTKGQIIWKNPDEPDDINTKENSMFRLYAEELEQERNATKAEQTLQQKQQDLANKQKSIQSNVGDTETAKNDIENINKDITNMGDKLNQTKTNAQDLKKASKKELDDKRKELEAAKKRIDKIKLPTK